MKAFLLNFLQKGAYIIKITDKENKVFIFKVMRVFIVVSIVFILLSCQKEHNLGEDYNKLVGTWGNINGDDSVTVNINSNGLFEYHRSFERRGKFFVKSIKFLYYDAENFVRCDLIGKKRGITLFVNDSFDSLKIYSSDFSFNHHYDSYSPFYLVKK